jgi:hypothetical protein
MNARRLGFWLFTLGVVGVIGSAVWWANFYTQVMKFMNRNEPPPFECLYQFTGPCRTVSNVAGFVGAGSYEPVFFWVSLLVGGIGLVLWIRGIAYSIAGTFQRR